MRFPMWKNSCCGRVGRLVVQVTRAAPPVATESCQRGAVTKGNSRICHTSHTTSTQCGTGKRSQFLFFRLRQIRCLSHNLAACCRLCYTSAFQQMKFIFRYVIVHALRSILVPQYMGVVMISSSLNGS